MSENLVQKFHSVLKPARAEPTLFALCRLQVRSLPVLYLDDFGTGYSSLSYLRGLPLDGLKIDRSFVSDLEHTEIGLAGAIVGMARQLGLETVAEGVESALQLERLKKLGCERLQGFLFAGALPVREVETMLRELGMRETPLE